MFRLIVLISLVLNLYAQENLVFQDGTIKAHTEVFGDDKIEPMTNVIESDLSMKNSDITSLNGLIYIATTSLKSTSESRDESMYETLKSQEFPQIAYNLKSIKKVDNGYETVGTLSLGGVTKEVPSKIVAVTNGNTILLEGSFSIKLTDFNIEPPSMFFVTVRDQIDITYNLNYKLDN